MTMEDRIASAPQFVKRKLVGEFENLVEILVRRAQSGVRPRDLELETWEVLFALGRLLLATLLGVLCRRVTERDIEERGLSEDDVRFRLDVDYWACQTTTLGKIAVPLFTYRDYSSGLCVTRTPARDQILPARGRCRSSELCLEFESRLGSEFPFRRAEEALQFFSHGEVCLTDTTIAAHTLAIGAAIDRKWLYRAPDEMRRLISERAQLDKETGQPAVCVSTDAHAERTYVDETWQAAWKMTNGIRIWIIDRFNGSVIHLGGEYTWGDCHEVGHIVEQLIDDGILPRDGDYGDGVQATLVAITDGAEWIVEYVLKRLPWAIAVLDLYHALERLGRLASTWLRKGSKACKKWYRRLARNLVAQSQKQEPAPKRRGHNKRKRDEANVRERRHRRRAGSGWALLGALYEEEVPGANQADYETALDYFERNAERMDYDRYRARGLEIGSGAMESLHRIAGQCRIRIPGARWLRESAQAILNLRMLQLAGRWNEFWGQEDLSGLLAQAFAEEAECR